MGSWLLLPVVWTARVVLALRYRVRVRGLEKLRGAQGALLLPSHPAFMDPALFVAWIWPKLRARPLAEAEQVERPWLISVVRWLGAVLIPDTDLARAGTRERVDAAFAEIATGLRSGDSFVVWPAGRVRRGRREVLGRVTGPARILREAPEARVFLIRTNGLWGSMFSYAWDGAQPPLGRRLLRGALILLSNLVLLTPRRQVEIEVEELDRAQWGQPTPETLNPFLEDWFNQPEPEEPHFVPYHFLFGPRTREYPPDDRAERFDLSQVSAEVKAAARECLAEVLGRELPPEAERPGTPLEELGLDSLDVMDVLERLRQRVEARGEEVPRTVGGLWAFAAGLEEPAALPPPPAWWSERAGRETPAIEGNTLAAALAWRVRQSPRRPVLADALSPPLTCERLWLGASLLARRFRKIPGDYVGVLLPASVAADVTLLGLVLAGKIPAPLNWTTGTAAMEHARKLLGLRAVISSKRFLARIELPEDFADVITLEELREGIGSFEKLLALLGTRLLPALTVRPRSPQPDPESPAVVLFTSGSESAPKAVPLTHQNLLANFEGVLASVSLIPDEVMLGFLPPFHSFGLSLTSFLPILAGVRVVHHADPTDVAGLTRVLSHFGATLMPGTPTFLSKILNSAESEDLRSLRLVMVGAEPCPPQVMQQAEALIPDVEVLEGYGITECSPLVTCNRPGRARPGSIGEPLTNVDLLVVNPEDSSPTVDGERGLLLVAAPSVFPGYLGDPRPDAFAEVDGRRWYRTGDLVRIDEDGYVFFEGRTKRFLKAGGEMISLPALEQVLSEAWPPDEAGPRVAVEGRETGTGARIVLFTTTDISVEAANRHLRDRGFRGVMRVDAVEHLEAIPVLGTGKTDHRTLRERISP